MANDHCDTDIGNPQVGANDAVSSLQDGSQLTDPSPSEQATGAAQKKRTAPRLATSEEAPAGTIMPASSFLEIPDVYDPVAQNQLQVLHQLQADYVLLSSIDDPWTIENRLGGAEHYAAASVAALLSTQTMIAENMQLMHERISFLEKEMRAARVKAPTLREDESHGAELGSHDEENKVNMVHGAAGRQEVAHVPLLQGETKEDPEDDQNEY